jgi:hypothetical protein
MIPIEQTVSPLVENMFPSFYHEEGPNFVAFMKAYYEWLETPTQTLELADATGFDVGDDISQELSTNSISAGIVLTKDTNTILVQLTSDEQFRCVQREGVLIPVLSSTGSSTIINLSSSDNVIHHARNITSYRDIDTTIDKFILHFKEKYLKNIQFDIATNKKLLVKNSFDLYRSKGTSRSIDLFFKLVYGINAEVYYPGDDIFRLSDGVWEIPKYLEVTGTNKSIDYVGKQITGVTSGATAFVEKFIKRRIKGGVVSILYVSNPVGSFINNEVLKSDAIYPDSPRVIGSLDRLEIITGGRGYVVGDIVEFISTKGSKGKARVTEVANTTGVVDFLLIDGGWGYTTNAESVVSEKVISLTNVVTSNNRYFKPFENIYQPMANISFVSANADLAVGDHIYKYHANNLQKGHGYILSLSQTSGANVGNFRASVISGDLTGSARFYVGANTKQANLSAYADFSAYAVVCGVSTNATISVSNTSGAIGSRLEVFQSNSSGEYANAYVDAVTVVGSVYTLQISNTQGAFRGGGVDPISTRAGVTGNVGAVALTVGLYNISNTFFPNNAFTVAQNTASNGYSTALSEGYGAGFSVGTIGETETIFINTDFLAANNTTWLNAVSAPQANQEFMSIPLNQFAYGFEKRPQGNSSSIIFSCLTFGAFEMGTIGSLSLVDPGADYNIDPYVMVYQPHIAGFDRHDWVMDISGASRSFAEGERILQTSASLTRYVLSVGNTTGFQLGEKIRQGANVGVGTITSITSGPNTFIIDNVTGTFNTASNVYSFVNATATCNVSLSTLTSLLYTAKGIVKANSNSSTLFVERIQFNDTWTAGQTITGQASGTTATIVATRPDSNTLPIGLNAVVEANVVIADGTVTSLDIMDSGFGYSNSEILQYYTTGNDLGEAKVIIDGLGAGEGYFKSSKGFLSDNKYIQDSDYYQEYSYDIISKLPFDKYADVFKKVMHTAGTRVFGSVVVAEEDSVKLTIAESEIEQV